ncbi:hypothetical protein ROJ8625_00929 [Roseivivax jejudonensis]|uniref:Uncharacterized protein n=1 Tax=Roseivivax jejudonensis TaxID=1529041 RepID=A0A1X6YKG0_9RHOB|nr:hypothetical protein [Roseivivax jejudonensis]SLN23246.1 hypothetical protein ROJ8625_00929 [Roseivivax jejudonensis]
MTTLNIEGRRVQVDDSFKSLSPEEQERTVEEIAQSLRIKAGSAANRGFMPNVNQGIAESVGGLVDFINPFDRPHGLNPFSGGTGSAQTAIERGMDAIGTNRAQGAPQTLVESFGRGTGQAAGAAIPAGATVRVMSGAGGLIGNIADDAAATLNTPGGLLTEMVAGGSAQTAESAAEAAGAPEWVSQSAAIAGGMGAAAVPYAARMTPSAIGARQLGRAVRSAAIPYTESGAREVARTRVQELAGGPARGEELAREIANGSEIGLTPAQITQDPNLLALEQTAARQSPELRERLNARMDGTTEAAAGNLRDMGGDVTEAQAFFATRRQQARDRIDGFVRRATNDAVRPVAQRSEAENSARVSEQIRTAEQRADAEEAQLWDAVPRGVQVSTGNARRVANELIQATPRAQQNDIPRVVRDLLGEGSNSGFAENETVGEMHGLYSELRRVARSAMAGNDQNRNMARIANNVADAILDDLGARGGGGEVGRAINEARAYSAAKHEIFDRGTVGRLLKRTLDGDEQINPDLTLERSVGRGGTSGRLGMEEITRAADTDATQEGIEDYLRSRFDRAAFKSDGAFSETGARNFMRDNRETLDRVPYLRDTLDEAVRTQSRAASAQARGNRARSDMDNPSRSSTAAFETAAPENAVDQVFKARRPSVEARGLAATARKDTSGQALDGLRGSLADYVIRRSGGDELSGRKMREFLRVPENRAALAQVFKPEELRRFDQVATELVKADTARKPTRDIGAVSNRSPNRLIEYVARVVAARQGAKAGGGGGGSIQTAQMASGRVKQLLGNLQNDKAEQLLIDAIEDPELFRLLLTDPGQIKLKAQQVNRLVPYFTGGLATRPEEREAAQ